MELRLMRIQRILNHCLLSSLTDEEIFHDILLFTTFITTHGRLCIFFFLELLTNYSILGSPRT